MSVWWEIKLEKGKKMEWGSPIFFFFSPNWKEELLFFVTITHFPTVLKQNNIFKIAKL